ncbi:MAG: hypothetical protein QOF37_1785 [Thermoleophilaceae bacterium]|nr:hypothetical protein [Thermoleophilaceae bacterium]
MHLRRALILFALVLGLTALAASIAPAPRTPPEQAVAPPPPLPAVPAAGTLTVAFGAPAPRRGPPSRKVVPGSHVVVEVVAASPGDVRIPKLGRIDSVTPSAPASFDLLAPPPGRYDVLFEPPLALGPAVRVGTLVSAG